MKRILAILIVQLACGLGARADFIMNAVPTAIPDNNALGVQQTLELSGFSGPIESVSVRLTISGINGGAFNGDLFVTLQHDSGYSVLLNRVGRTSLDPFGYADNGFDLTFTAAGNDIHAYQSGVYTLGGSGELTGTWGADGRTTDPLSVVATDSRTSTLSSFNGLDANGTWTLFVADTSQNGEAQLNSWGLEVTVVPEPSTVAFMALGLVALAARRRAMA